MKLCLSKQNWVTVLEGIVALINSKEKFNINFSYFLSKARRMLDDEIKTITDAANKILEAYYAELKETKSIDETGKILDSVKLSTVDVKYKTEKEQVNEFFKEKVDLDIFTIKLEKVDEIDAINFDKIFPLIVEESTTETKKA
jgi:hypothetical protein